MISGDIEVKGRCGGTAWSKSYGMECGDLRGSGRRLGMKRETGVGSDIRGCVRMEMKGPGMSGKDFSGGWILFF